MRTAQIAMTNPTMKRQVEPPQVNSETSPFLIEFFLVQGPTYHCMGYLDEKGNWREAIYKGLLPGPVWLLEEFPASPDQLSKDVTPKNRSQHPRKHIHVLPTTLIGPRQTRFLVAFCAALLILSALAQLMLLNSAPGPQFKNKFSNNQPATEPNLILQIVEEKRS